MPGIITIATAAASAGPEPEMPPRNMHTSTATMAGPPARLPTSTDTKRTSRSATPARSKIMPARMKTGSASSGYLAMPVYTLVGTDMMPSPSRRMTIAPARPSPTASGAPSSSSSPKPSRRMTLPSASIAPHAVDRSRDSSRARRPRMRNVISALNTGSQTV